MITDDITWTTSYVDVWVTSEGTEPTPTQDDAVAYAEELEGRTSMQADPYAHGWVVRFERHAE